jgi:hypothetical protein
MNSDAVSRKITKCSFILTMVVALAALSGCGGTPKPTITAVSPTHLSPAGGAQVTITGSNFNANALVTFGGLPSPTVKWVNSGTMIATAPRSATNGSVAVSVGSATLANALTYDLDGITCSGAVCTYAADGYYNSIGPGADIATCTGSPDGNAVGNLQAGAGDYVIINNVNVPTDGTYTMTVYGAEDQGGNGRDFAVYVNGSTDVLDVWVTGGTSWTAPAPGVPVPVSLKAGNNSIEFTGNNVSADGFYWGPNLCWITVGPAAK